MTMKPLKIKRKTARDKKIDKDFKYLAEKMGYDESKKDAKYYINKIEKLALDHNYQPQAFYGVYKRYNSFVSDYALDNTKRAFVDVSPDGFNNDPAFIKKLENFYNEMNMALVKNNPKMRRNPMRTISHKVEVGQLEDFSPKDQAKIIDNYRDINVDHDWWDFIYEDMIRCLETLGFYKIEIQFRGFWSQGDGASFTAMFETGSKSDLKRRLKKLDSEAHDIAEKARSLGFADMEFHEEELEDGRVEIYRTSHHYAHENTITSDNEDLKEFARAFSKLIYRQLEGEYEFLTSDEAVRETLETNEYEFDASTLKISRY